MMPGDKVIYEVNPEYLARSPIAADEELYVTKVSPFMVELSDSTVSFHLFRIQLGHLCL